MHSRFLIGQIRASDEEIDGAIPHREPITKIGVDQVITVGAGLFMGDPILFGDMSNLRPAFWS